MSKEVIYPSQATYDYTKTYPKIDYSEIVTEPGLVLSMREIFNRYAAQGIDLLQDAKDRLVPDDDRDFDMNDSFDDDLDVLQQARSVRQRQDAFSRRSASATKKGSKKEPEEPKPAPKNEEPKQSEGNE